jgi:23S rRNA (cytidine1920-2'-O)/16S rRNA (cytidine1409-2'-O)-methyltransferase
MTQSGPDEKRQRLDNALVERGLAPSRARARDAILRGHVTVDGEPADRPAQAVASAAHVAIDDPVAAYVSRAALKLVAALDHFGYSAEGVAALDIGASTGGFTEVLIRRGARRVFGVDVGRGQLHQRLATDRRVVNLEGVNARDLKAARVSEPVSAVTADVSFISLKLALPPALALATEKAWGVFLVKPQFEVGRGHIGKGGIVRDHAIGRAAADDIAAWLSGEMAWTVDGIIDSPIEGGDGNREYLIGARRG